MRYLFHCLLLGLIFCFATRATIAEAWTEVHLADAERFAHLLKQTGYRPTANELRRHYLEPGSDVLAEFADQRVGDADDLARAIRQYRQDYLKAMEVCLPAARKSSRRLRERVRRVGKFLHRPERAPVTLLFGAGRSGGTAGSAGVVVALEVLCWFAENRQDARKVLEEFVVHEAVHFHQFAVRDRLIEDSLLRQALMEGFADFVAEQVLGRVSRSESARHQFGLVHEARIFSEFESQMRGVDLGHWMYGPGAPGQPADLGYWIGKRICASYHDVAGGGDVAISTLLRLESPLKILQESGYAESMERIGSKAYPLPDSSGSQDQIN